MLQAEVHIAQHRRAIRIGKGEVLHVDPLRQTRGNAFACIAHVFVQAGGQLVHQRQRSPAAGQQRRQLGHGGEHKVHQLHKQDDHAGGNALTGDGQVRAQDEHAHLRQDACALAQHVDALRRRAPRALAFLQRGVFLIEQPLGLALGTKALEHRKAAEQILDRAHKAGVSLRNLGFARGQAAARQHGNRHGQKRQRRARDSEERTVIEHHGQRAEKDRRQRGNAGELGQVIALKHGDIVGQG